MTETCMRRYDFRLYPTAAQDAALREQCRMVAQLWNALLQRREDVYRREKRTLSRFALEYEITQLRRECPEWQALSTWTARRVNALVDRAVAAFFRRLKAGAASDAWYPRYKRVAAHASIPHRCASGCRLLPRGGRNWALKIKGIKGAIHARGTLPGPITKWTDADIMLRHGAWYVSVAVERSPARDAGRESITVRFDGIDSFAVINGRAETPDELIACQRLQDDIDRRKAERDRRWPTRAPDDADWLACNRELAKLWARVKAKRKNALHVWTTRLVRRARDITIVTPAVNKHTRSARGTRANVGAVATLNRHVLSLAIASAVHMLEYKAAEAGIPCCIVNDAAPEIAIGGKLVAAGKAIRRARRAMNEMEAIA